MEEKIEEARQEFNSILQWLVSLAVGCEVHEVEEGLYKRLLKLGRILLEVFILAVGSGKQGRAVLGDDGKMYRYVGDKPRKYLSLFGEIAIMRARYACEGRASLFPLDGVLNLPERKYSYALQSRLTGEAVQKTFESSSAWVKEHLHLEVAHRPIQRITRDCTSGVEEFMESLEAPPVEEEGSILVQTADCKGIPMRPGERNADLLKTEDKPGEKRMACVARGYSIDPHFRPPEEIVESFFQGRPEQPVKTKERSRPRPRHRRTFASLKQGKSTVFSKSEQAVKARLHESTKEKAILMDGERALWNLSAGHFPDWTEIIDFTHVMEKLWIAAEIHYGKDGLEKDEYVRERALALLEGDVDLVIEDFRTALEDGSLSPLRAARLKRKVLGYFLNNRQRMAYDEYLAKGLPIATGVIESTCKTLINSRMEGSGMPWSQEGAEAILKLRGVLLDDLWHKFWEFRTKSERKRLYSRYRHLTDNWGKEHEIQKAA
jgi:hypothetical protein